MQANPYESDFLLATYLLFHYGHPEEILPPQFLECGRGLSAPTLPPNNEVGALRPLPHSSILAASLNFPARCISECLDVQKLPPHARALDLGCAVGRSSFELARHCETIIGVDYSRRFIEAATHLKNNGRLEFMRCEEGEIATPCTAVVPKEINRNRVSFEVGDAQVLRETLGQFDVVLMANLIDRLADPARCLRQLPQLVNPGGQLIITSPYTWLEEFTPRANWLGGTDGTRTLDALKKILTADFDLVAGKDLPFLIREHARKFQWSVAEATVWIRRG